MPKDLAIVLNNGSVNSAVATALAVQRYRLVMVFVESTPAAGTRSRQAYDLQVQFFKPFREHTVTLPFLAGPEEGRKSGTSGSDPRMPTLLSPHLTRLLPLIASATSYASQYQAAAIYLGLRVGPETNELAQATEYLQIWNELIQLPCAHTELEVIAPLLELEPWQVIDLAFNVGTPLERTWSCSEEHGEACWACKGCRGREAAFVQAAKPDPSRPPRR